MSETQHPSNFPQLVSVIIPARDVADVLGNQLKALSNQDYEDSFEVIVVDNCSTDATANVALGWTETVPNLRVVPAEHPGINRARNAGAAAARGDFLLFCDADDVAAPNWIRKMTAAAYTADVVGGHVDANFLNSPHIRASRAPHPPDRLPKWMGFPYAVGASLGVHKAVFDALGGFNVRYSGGGDDVEFSLRAQLSGHSLAFAPDTVMHYRLRTAIRLLTRQQFNYGRADAQLLHDFRRRDMASGLTLGSVRYWGTILWRLPTLLSSQHRLGWISETALIAGRLAGSIRYRVWCP